MIPSFLPRGLAAPAYGSGVKTFRPEWEGVMQPPADPMMELMAALQAQGAPGRAGSPRPAQPASPPQPSPSWNLPSMTGRMRPGGMAGGVGGGT